MAIRKMKLMTNMMMKTKMRMRKYYHLMMMRMRSEIMTLRMKCLKEDIFWMN